MRLIDKEAYEEKMHEIYCNPCAANGRDHFGVMCKTCWVDAAIDTVNTMTEVETPPKVIEEYPDGTIVVRVEDIEKVGRVMVSTGHYCKMFYEEHLVQVSERTEEEAVEKWNRRV